MLLSHGIMFAYGNSPLSAVRGWLFDMIGYDVGDNLFEALGDGVILCSICNTIRPGIVTKVHARAQGVKQIDDLSPLADQPGAQGRLQEDGKHQQLSRRCQEVR